MRRVAVLPNLFTTGNMVCGISAILYSLSGSPEDLQRACLLILLAVLFDGLDGIIAVLTRACTKFGVQYDSLADLISFGMAPSMLLIANYRFSSGTDGRLPREFWVIAVVLVVCTALRLARYNVQAGTTERKSFQGLPCPSQACFIALLLLSFNQYEYQLPPKALMLVAIALGALMVSNLPYPSLKKSDFFQTQPLSTFLLVVLASALVVVEPIGAALLSISGYILYGLVHQVASGRVRLQVVRFYDMARRRLT